MKNLLPKLLVTGLLAIAQSASAILLVQYDPTGPQLSGTPVPTAFVAPGVAATALSQVGLENFWGNNNVWPVGQITSSPTINLGEYLTFQVTGNLDFDNLTYDSRSYSGTAARQASIRSSLDGFAADIDTLSGLSGGDQLLTFDLSSLAATAGLVEFRLYFYDATVDHSDWNDLRSTAVGGTGLQLNGTNVPDTGSTLALLALGLAVIACFRRAVARA